MTLFTSCIRRDAADKYILIWEVKSEYTLKKGISITELWIPIINSWKHIIHDIREYHNSVMDTIMDIHNSIMDIHNYELWLSMIQL